MKLNIQIVNFLNKKNSVQYEYDLQCYYDTKFISARSYEIATVEEQALEAENIVWYMNCVRTANFS